ncbi:MAG: hypothetical protein QY318_00685 [Candidatus Dojkabacteria bacterium]|nr:MAG: hypothetical protein QY318_00685 [Candidatus Dojkabacteria bacterium]
MITKVPLLEAILTVTPIYFFIGNYSWEIDTHSTFLQEYKERIENGEDAGEVAYSMHLRNNKLLRKESEWFGCFRYKYVETENTIKIHFRNIDRTTHGPLSINNKSFRLTELKKMFTHIKEQHPEARYVQGNSWLYNYESYRRLFPASYTKDMKVSPTNTQYMVIWGQFLDSEWQLKRSLANEFSLKIDAANSVDELKSSFNFQNLAPRGRIKDFYDFYEIQL